MRVGAWICVAGAAFFGLFAVGFAVARAVEHPSLRDLVVDAHGLPSCSWWSWRSWPASSSTRARWAASAVAVAGAATLVILPIEEAWPERGGFVAVAGLRGRGGWVLARAGDWFRGARAGRRLSVRSGSLLAAAPWVGRLLAVVAEGASASRTDDLATRLRPG